MRITVEPCSFFAGMLSAAVACAQQPYPAKPILLISPVQAGSAGDTSIRLVAQKMSEHIGQQVLVENQPGAAGMIGAERVARAAPDGYTIGGISDSTLTYVPTLSESGVPGFVFSTWTGIYAPKGTPRPIIERLNLETAKAVNDNAVRERLKSLGADPRRTTPEQLADLTRSTFAKTAKIIKEAGIKAE